MDTMQILCDAEDSFLSQDIIPVTRITHPDYGLTQDEVIDRDEFIRLSLIKDFVPILSLARKDSTDDTYLVEYIGDCAIDIYLYINTVIDRWLFTQYSYGIRRIMEKVQDLAHMNSAISSDEGKINIRNRFEILIKMEFIDRIHRLSQPHTKDSGKRYQLDRKIAKLNSLILEARKIWERNAP